MTDALGQLLSRLKNVKDCGKYFSARCPAHDDHRPSLSISESLDRILIYCHAGCTPEAVTSSIGFDMRDLFFADSRTDSRTSSTAATMGKLVAVYRYEDEAGRCLFETVRYEPKDFRQRVPDGLGGHRYSLKGVRRVLYRLPFVLEQAGRHGQVFIVEGEKDADALCSLGLIATTSPLGAGKWRKEYAAFLKGARVVIIPDNDLAGDSHAKDIVKSVHGLAQEVRILRLPEVPPKGDVSDWIALGGTRDKLESLARQAELIKHDRETSSPQGIVRRFSEIERREPRWLWPSWLVYGQLNQLIGDPEVGKSMIAYWLCAAVSRGEPFPDGQPNPWGPQNVLIMAAEDDIESVVKPRLQAAGADESRIFYLDGTYTKSGEERIGIQLFKDQDVIRQAVINNDIAFLYIDSLSDTLSSAETDPNNELKVREVLSIPKRIAEELGCSVLFTRHKSKASGRSAVLGGLGSVAHAAVVRSSLDAVIDPVDPSRRILARNKSNLAAPVSSLVYSIEDCAGIGPRVVWKGSDPRSANDLLIESESGAIAGGELVRATQFLKSLLADGPQSFVHVRNAAEDDGISAPTLNRAAVALGVQRNRSGKGASHTSTWSLPQGLQASGPIETSWLRNTVNNSTTTVWDSTPESVGAELSRPTYQCNQCNRKFFDNSPFNPDGFGCAYCVATGALP